MLSAVNNQRVAISGSDVDRRKYFVYVTFFFNDPATTEIYSLSLHAALPISSSSAGAPAARSAPSAPSGRAGPRAQTADRESPPLNSSHYNISDAVFRLK